jgi:hypothetical protein
MRWSRATLGLALLLCAAPALVEPAPPAGVGKPAKPRLDFAVRAAHVALATPLILEAE